MGVAERDAPYGARMTPPGAAPRVPPAARFLPPGVFYGWYVALACGLMMWVTVGVGYYGLSIFLRPLQEEHDWSAGVVSGASGLYFVVSGVSAFVVGPVIDRRGPKRMMAIGARPDGSERRSRRLRRVDLAAVPRVRADGAGVRDGRRRRRRVDHVEVVHPPPREGHLAVLDRRVAGRRHARADRHLAHRRGRAPTGGAGARRARGDRRPARPVAGGRRRSRRDGPAGRRSRRPRRRPSRAPLAGAARHAVPHVDPASRTRHQLVLGHPPRVRLGAGHADGGAHPPAVVPPGARQAGLALGRRAGRHRDHDRLDRGPPRRRAVHRRQGRQAGR